MAARRSPSPGGRCRALAVALPLLAGAAARAEPPLNVCVDADHAPFSSSATPTQGFDLDVGQALAARLGRTAQFVWVDVPTRGGLPKALREHLGTARCDLFTAVPVGGDEPLDKRWRQSAPYAVLRYRWTAAAGQPVPADPPSRARAIGVVSATPADLYLHTHRLRRTPYPNNAALLAALSAGDVPVALVWSAALSGATPPWVLSPRGPDDPTLRTALTLVGRSADSALGEAVSTALTALETDGTLARLRSRHGLPDDPAPLLPSTP
jgi:ABC-type amino acid transport substrate-binding protein